MASPKGHIRKHGDSYQVAVPVGRDPVTKRYRYAYDSATAIGLAALGAGIGITGRDRGPAPRQPRQASAPRRAAQPWTPLPPTCPPKLRCAV